MQESVFSFELVFSLIIDWPANMPIYSFIHCMKYGFHLYSFVEELELNLIPFYFITIWRSLA